MDSNYSQLQDLYTLVHYATDILNPIKRQELLEFLDVQIQIEEDSSFDIDNLHDPEFKLRSHLNG